MNLMRLQEKNLSYFIGSDNSSLGGFAAILSLECSDDTETSCGNDGDEESVQLPTIGEKGKSYFGIIKKIHAVFPEIRLERVL
jgi:hypothetical protein